MAQDDSPDWFTELESGGFQQGHYHPAPLAPEEEKRGRKRRIRRRIIGFVTLGVVLALVATYVCLTLTAPVGAAASSIKRPTVLQPAAATIAMPAKGEAAVSISGGDDYLGTGADGIFASRGGNGRLPMASISKVITALVILNARPLGASGKGATITWTPADAKLYDKYYVLNATIAAMKSGTSMSEHDALETMLVASACNYAEATSDWAFGSEANFLYAARKWLAANGMHSTTMVESTGISLANTSTPSDLITLGKIAMANPAVAEMVSETTPDATPATEEFNTNDLLGTEGIDGIKTGTLNGSDLLFHSNIQPGTPSTLSITGIVLGGDSRVAVDADVKAMIDSIANGFHQVDLGSTGEIVGTYSTPWGSKASMVLAKDASTLTWSSTLITSTMTTTTLKTGKKGETVGSVTWTAGKTTVTVPVVLAGKVHGPSTWWRLTHPKQLLGW